MNTDKTIDQKFLKREEYPIWYYKELEEVDVSYVVLYMLTETFVVEIDGSKHEITFGKNRKHEIGQCIRYDDIKNSNLSSYRVIDKGFRKGKWFRISEKDTTDEFKKNYVKRKEELTKKKIDKLNRDILKNFIRGQEDLSEEKRSIYLKQIEQDSSKNIEKLIEALFK